MSTIKQVITNSAWIIFCRCMKVILAAVVSIYTARMLGTADFGLINYASSVISFISPFVLLGYNSILVKELLVAHCKEGTILGTAIISSAICSCIGMGVAAGISYLFSPSDMVGLRVSVIYSVTLLFHSTELIQYWFQAKYRSKTVALVGLISYAVVSLYKIILLANRAGIYWFALSNAVDYLLISSTLLYIYVKEDNPKLKFSWSTFKKLLNRGYSYAVSAFMVNVFTQVDKLMIKSIIGNSQNGLYSVAVACAGMFVFVFSKR